MCTFVLCELPCYDVVFAFGPVTSPITCFQSDMIDMEVDFQPSLYRSTTPNSMKRARSPELGQSDRPLVCHTTIPPA